MYLEHFWLSVIGIFIAGMLSMLGLLIGADMRAQRKRPKVRMGLGYDPRNPINARSIYNAPPSKTEAEWYEVRPGEWM